MNFDYVAQPEDFEDKLFAENNKALFDEYIDLLILGNDERAAFALVFGHEMVSDNLGHLRILCTKRNPYFKSRFKRRLEEMPLSDMWSVKRTVHSLLRLVYDPDCKDSAKLNAIRELNVIYGITMIDEHGNSKLGRSMDDFYGKLEENGLYPSQGAAKH